MSESASIELSLLDGMDEKLLERLHREGIRTRDELGRRLASQESRRELADALGIPLRRLEILHHLNFLMPEERADQFLDLARGTHHRSEGVRRNIRTLAVAAGVATVLGGAALFLALSNRGSGHEERITTLEERLADTESMLAAIRPLAAGEAEERLLGALAHLGPAPGWHGPLRWAEEDHRTLVVALGDEGDNRIKALSVAFRRLTELENADTLSFETRVRRMGEAVADFPPPVPENELDWAAVALRGRFRSRALGRVGEEALPGDIGRFPWTWTSPGFVVAEALATRLDQLPVDEARFVEWAETVGQIDRVADAGRSDLSGRPESLAGEYWSRLGEIKLGVTGALLARADLLPYTKLSPRNFLVNRRESIRNTLAGATPAVRPPMAWLLVECEEAILLAVWWEAHPQLAATAGGMPYAEALAFLERERRLEGMTPSADLEAAVRAALETTGLTSLENPYTAPRTRWEAGLRPLLMETRLGSENGQSRAALEP